MLVFRTPVAFTHAWIALPGSFFLQESTWSGANVQLPWDTLSPLTGVVTLGQPGHRPSCDSVQQLIINGCRIWHFGSTFGVLQCLPSGQWGPRAGRCSRLQSLKALSLNGQCHCWWWRMSCQNVLWYLPGNGESMNDSKVLRDTAVMALSLQAGLYKLDLCFSNLVW